MMLTSCTTNTPVGTATIVAQIKKYHKFYLFSNTGFFCNYQILTGVYLVNIYASKITTVSSICIVYHHLQQWLYVFWDDLLKTII